MFNLKKPKFFLFSYKIVATLFAIFLETDTYVNINKNVSPKTNFSIGAFARI